MYDLRHEDARARRARLHAWDPAAGASASRDTHRWREDRHRAEADAARAARDAGRASSALGRRGGSILGRPLRSRRPSESGDLRGRRESASAAVGPGARGPGWWRCGNCRAANNPALTPDRCCECFAWRDAYATNLDLR